MEDSALSVSLLHEGFAGKLSQLLQASHVNPRPFTKERPDRTLEPQAWGYPHDEIW